MAYLEYIMKCAGVPEGEELTKRLNALREDNNLAKVGSEYSTTLQSLFKTGSDDMYQLGRLTALSKYAAAIGKNQLAPFFNAGMQNTRNMVHNNYYTRKTTFRDATNELNAAQSEVDKHQKALDNFLAPYKGVAPTKKNSRAYTKYQTLKNNLDQAQNTLNSKKVTHQAAKTDWDAVNTSDYRRQMALTTRNLYGDAYNSWDKANNPLMHRVRGWFGLNRSDPAQQLPRQGGFFHSVKGWMDKVLADRSADHAAARTQREADAIAEREAREKLNKAQLEATEKELEDDRVRQNKRFDMQMQLYSQMPKWVGGGLALAGIGGPLMYNMVKSDQPQIMYAPPMPAPMPMAYPAQR